jgi:replication factor C large subunit
MSDSLPFPEPLAERYRPRHIAEFIGLEKPRKILNAFLARPHSSAWLFVGPPGVGKTTMALAFAEELGALPPFDLHKIPSQKCTVQTVEDTVRLCWYCPHKANGFHVVIVDEADQMSPAAQLSLLSKLDASDPPPNTIWIFTANDTERLEKRFLSRCRTLEFSSYGMRECLADFLRLVWKRETGADDGAPDFLRLAKDATNNVRDALMRLELELLAR